MYVIGDVVDRGKEPIKLLIKIMETPNITLLEGNHEEMMSLGLDPIHEKEFFIFGSGTVEKIHSDSSSALKRNREKKFLIISMTFPTIWK